MSVECNFNFRKDSDSNYTSENSKCVSDFNKDLVDSRLNFSTDNCALENSDSFSEFRNNSVTTTVTAIENENNETPSKIIFSEKHRKTDEFLNSLLSKRSKPSFKNTLSVDCNEVIEIMEKETDSFKLLNIGAFCPPEDLEAPIVIIDRTDAEEIPIERKYLSVSLSLDFIKKKLEKRKKFNLFQCKQNLGSRKFCAKIEPNDNHAAESELSREITKSMFKDVSILYIYSF